LGFPVGILLSFVVICNFSNTVLFTTVIITRLPSLIQAARFPLLLIAVWQLKYFSALLRKLFTLRLVSLLCLKNILLETLDSLA